MPRRLSYGLEAFSIRYITASRDFSFFIFFPFFIVFHVAPKMRPAYLYSTQREFLDEMFTEKDGARTAE